MRRLLYITVLLTLILSACASSEPAEQPSIIIEVPPNTPASQNQTAEPTFEQPSSGPAEQATMRQLAANLRLRESDVSILRSEATQFSNTCLDVVLEGVECTQESTPGYIIILEASGLQYKYHANEDGNLIQPATIALVWKREGGIAGFCDTLTVFLSGEVFASPCALETPQPNVREGKMGTFANLLSTSEKTKLNGWITRLAQANLDASDPQGVSDRMVVTLTVYGVGSKPVTQVEQRELFNFAQNLYDKLIR
jgi:hypothetical protein